MYRRIDVIHYLSFWGVITFAITNLESDVSENWEVRRSCK